MDTEASLNHKNVSKISLNREKIRSKNFDSNNKRWEGLVDGDSCCQKSNLRFSAEHLRNKELAQIVCFRSWNHSQEVELASFTGNCAIVLYDQFGAGAFYEFIFYSCNNIAVLFWIHSSLGPEYNFCFC